MSYDQTTIPTKKAGRGPVALAALWSAAATSVMSLTAAQAATVPSGATLEQEARDAAARAGAYCPGGDVADRTYEILAGLDDMAPYNGVAIADMLQELEDKNIVVRAPAEGDKMFDRIGAIFIKGENGAPDVLVINENAEDNPRLAEFIQKILDEADNLAPGAGLVLDQSAFGTNSIVGFEPGAKKYQPDRDDGAPFMTYVRLHKPGAGCGPV